MKKDKAIKEPKKSKEQETMASCFCSLTEANLQQIIIDYHVDPRYELRLPGENDTVLSAPEGFEPVYLQFILCGLRFPINEFIVEVLRSLKLHIIQLIPNSFNKIIGFIMLSRALGIPLSVKLFCYFYTVTTRSDWAIFSLLPGKSECIHVLKDSIKFWKYGFFYVSRNAFFDDMEFGKVTGRGVDPTPILTEEEQAYVKTLSGAGMEWDDPDEVFIGMADLSPFY